MGHNPKLENFGQKSKIFVKNRTFWSKLKILLKNQKYWSQIEQIFLYRNLSQKSKKIVKIGILVKYDLILKTASYALIWFKYFYDFHEHE